MPFGCSWPLNVFVSTSHDADFEIQEYEYKNAKYFRKANHFSSKNFLTHSAVSYKGDRTQNFYLIFMSFLGHFWVIFGSFGVTFSLERAVKTLYKQKLTKKLLTHKILALESEFKQLETHKQK